jgi:hypothetical protein
MRLLKARNYRNQGPFDKARSKEFKIFVRTDPGFTRLSRRLAEADYVVSRQFRPWLSHQIIAVLNLPSQRTGAWSARLTLGT